MAHFLLIFTLHFRGRNEGIGSLLLMSRPPPFFLKIGAVIKVCPDDPGATFIEMQRASFRSAKADARRSGTLRH